MTGYAQFLVCGKNLQTQEYVHKHYCKCEFVKYEAYYLIDGIRNDEYDKYLERNKGR